jgi:hypothetical protein
MERSRQRSRRSDSRAEEIPPLFSAGFRDKTYIDWERDYKWEVHQRWEEVLNRGEFRRLLDRREYAEIAARAVRTEQRSRHSMIFSFEKMALADALKPVSGAKAFATGLYEFLHGSGAMQSGSPLGVKRSRPCPGAKPVS